MRPWADLPEELLDLILSKLFAKDRHNFSLVCRSWNAAAAASPYRYSPCLMFYQTTKHLWTFFQYNSFFSMSFPELDNAFIFCSKYGWLLMCGYDFRLFLFDPFNRQTIEVPSAWDYRYTQAYFFNPPTSPDCIIVGIVKPPELGGLEIGLLRHGEDKWGNYPVHQIENHVFSPSLAPPVLHCGLLYFLDLYGNVATFDINRPDCESSWNVYTTCLKSRRHYARSTEYFLFKIKGEEALFAVVSDDRKVNVFRLVEPDMDWKRLKNLGNKVLYLSNPSCFGDTAHLTSTAYKIYFAKSQGDGDSVVFYSLKTQKYHSFEGDYSSYNAYGLRRLNFGTWITPKPSPELATELTWCLKVAEPEMDYSEVC